MGKMKYTVLKSFVCMSLIAAIIAGLSSCRPMPNNGVPIYLHIDSSRVVTTRIPFGSDSAYIPDVWATTGSHNLGAYETPVDIPILASGNVPIAISAGIWDNGIVNVPAQYPFLAPDTFTIPNAIPGHVYHHKPVYNYFSYTQVAINEDFEASNHFDSIIIWNNPQNGNVFEGLSSGAIIVPAYDSSMRAQQHTPIQVNTNGREAYIELNYKISNPQILMEVGVSATTLNSGSFIGATDYSYVYLQGNGSQWRKVYLNFNNAIGSASAQPNTYFQVYLTVYHAGGVQDTVFVDNLKLLYFH